jgi:hypothetical protein
MNRRIAAAVIFATAMGASVMGVAADSDRPMGGSKDRQGMQEKKGMQGMEGMEGMMGMMSACQGMMGGHSAGAGFVPQLPPGNEKLQLQMSAEIMQKVGEITAKYANQIK